MISGELLKKIRRIEIASSRLVNSQLAGQYQSVFKGRGMAFSEVRPYQPGDDVRVIDWNVSARMNTPYVKLFREERDQRIMLLVDMSASGRFGSQRQTKQELAAELAALIAFSAIKNDDRVGLIIFSDHIEHFIPPQKGKKHVLRVVRDILSYKPSSRHTNIGVGLDYLRKVSKQKSVAFLVSDFLSSDWERSLRVAQKRHDLVPIVVSDPLEDKLPKVGLMMLRDLESGEFIEFDSSGREADEWRLRREHEIVERKKLFKRLKLDTIDVQTNESYGNALVKFFKLRAKRQQSQ